MNRLAFNFYWRMKPGMLLLFLLLIGLTRLAQGAEGITVSEPSVYSLPGLVAANGTVVEFYDVWVVKIYALDEEIGYVRLMTYPSFGYATKFSNATVLEFRGQISTSNLIPGFDHFYIEFTAKHKDDPNWVKNVKKFLVSPGVSLHPGWAYDIREYKLGSGPGPIAGGDPAELAEWGFTRLGEARKFVLSDFYVEFSIKGNVFKFDLTKWVPSIDLTLATDDSKFKEVTLVDSGDMGYGWWYWKLELKDWESRFDLLWPPDQSGEYGDWGATAVFNTEPKPMYAKVAFIGVTYKTFTSDGWYCMLPQKYDAYVLAFFNQTGEVKGNMTVRLVLYCGLSSYYRDLFTVPVDITIKETGRCEVVKPAFTLQTYRETFDSRFPRQCIYQHVNFTEPIKFGRHDHITFNFHCTVEAPYVWVESDPHLQTLKVLERDSYGKYLIYGLYKHFVPLSGNVAHVENGWIIQSNLEEYEAYLPNIEVTAETEVGGAFDFVVDDITVYKLPRPKIDPLPLFYDPTGRPVSKQEYDLSMEAYRLNKQAEAMMDAALDPKTQWPIFHSLEALTALEEARNESHRARMMLLYSYNYTDAKQRAQNAVDLITKAYNTEQSYQRMQLLIKWSPIITLIVVIVGAGALFFKRKIKKRASCINLSSQIGSSLCYDAC